MKMVNCLARYNKSLLTMAIASPLLAILILSAPALAAPVITLTPASGAIGTKVMINGTIFDSYKGDSVSISFDDAEIPGSPLTVPETGTFVTEFNIPDDATPGSHEVIVRSEVGSTSFLARSVFTVEEAEIKLDVTDGPVGTGVTISGRGFYAGRTVSIHYDNKIEEKLGTEAASPVGEFSYHFNIPNSTAGEHEITAKNAEGNSAETMFKVIPSITLNLTSAAPGELLSIRGTGFGYQNEVDIDFSTHPVAKARTDEYGNFEVKFNIPEVKPGTYDVKALDKHGNTDKAKFTITAGASLNQAEGSVDTELTVRGSGFKPGETVTVDYDNLHAATATTDNNGAFSATFNIPPSDSGAHVITVSDGKTTKQLAFNVESEAPPVPSLLSPADGSETGARAHLDWQDVTDPSLPVTYSLQVASDQNFSSLVLEKKGLTDSEYTLSEEEELPAVRQEAPYYWRVKARDSANNESQWSTPWSFYISFSFTLPGWAIYTLTGIGGIFVGLFAFWVGRRTAFRQLV